MKKEDMKTIATTAMLSLMSATIDGLQGTAIGILAVILLIHFGVRKHIDDMRDNPKRRYNHV